MTPTEQIARAVVTLTRNVHEAADYIAAENALDNAQALRLVWEGLAAQFLARSISDTDARAAKWRCRFRLYDQRRPQEPMADSDPELPADQPGTMIITGLPEVAVELGLLAGAFHGTPLLRGLSQQELDRKLRGLRPTLSRRKGNAVWRVPYDTDQTWRDHRDHLAGWLARVDIEREAT